MKTVLLPMKDGRKISLRTNDDGKMCIHWLRADPKGLIVTPVLGSMIARLGGFCGTIACNPLQNSIVSRVVNGVHLVCQHTGEVESATCPRCLATPEAVQALQRLKEMQSNFIHWVIVKPSGNLIACQQAATEETQAVSGVPVTMMRTEVKTEVSCPKCKAVIDAEDAGK